MKSIAFKEERITKLEAFCRDLLDYSKPVHSITYLNSMARDAIARFRTQYDKVLGQDHKLTVSFHYACKSTKEPRPNEKVSQRVENLKAFVRQMLSDAEVPFTFWTCQKLLKVARRTAKSRIVVPIHKSFSTDDSSTVCLVRLGDYVEHVLTGPDGKMNTSILEPNVRDYNGLRNPVNSQIRGSLTASDPKEEFWWLNNGITILATSCSVSGNKVSIGDPEIVNGLQTSHEMWGPGRPRSSDKRHVLLRVILPVDEKSRIAIIKATNSQTPVKELSLRSTEPVHLDIEDRLKLYGLFYDRRKGEHRRLRKPIFKIVGTNALVQAVVAIALQRPDDARARPLTYVGNHYDKVFNNDYDKDLYAACVLIDRQVEDYLEREQSLTTDERRDIRYYVAMAASCALASKAQPEAPTIAALAPRCIEPIDETVLDWAKNAALTAYRGLGATDKVAKGAEMRTRLVDAMRSRFS